MAKRLNKVKIRWSTEFAYAIGLIVTDGNMSVDGRHISFTTKDKQLAHLFKKCLGIKNKIGKKTRDRSKIKKYFFVQFGDKNLYEYFLSIGITPKKSKTIGKIKVPKKFFIDFLRGCIDGDGNISVFMHPESKNKQLKVRLTSASINFLNWIHETISNYYKIKGGHIYKDKIKSVSTLSYAKSDGGKILKLMYYNENIPFLIRKRNIYKNFGRVA